MDGLRAREAQGHLRYGVQLAGARHGLLLHVPPARVQHVRVVHLPEPHVDIFYSVLRLGRSLGLQRERPDQGRAGWEERRPRLVHVLRHRLAVWHPVDLRWYSRHEPTVRLQQVRERTAARGVIPEEWPDLARASQLLHHGHQWHKPLRFRRLRRCQHSQQ